MQWNQRGGILSHDAMGPQESYPLMQWDRRGPIPWYNGTREGSYPLVEWDQRRVLSHDAVGLFLGRQIDRQTENMTFSQATYRGNEDFSDEHWSYLTSRYRSILPSKYFKFIKAWRINYSCDWFNNWWWSLMQLVFILYHVMDWFMFSCKAHDEQYRHLWRFSFGPKMQNFGSRHEVTRVLTNFSKTTSFGPFFERVSCCSDRRVKNRCASFSNLSLLRH